MIFGYVRFSGSISLGKNIAFLRILAGTFMPIDAKCFLRTSIAPNDSCSTSGPLYKNG